MADCQVVTATDQTDVSAGIADNIAESNSGSPLLQLPTELIAAVGAHLATRGDLHLLFRACRQLRDLCYSLDLQAAWLLCQHGSAAVHVACRSGSRGKQPVALIQLLLSHRQPSWAAPAPADLQYFGYTPLHEAADRGYDEVIALFLRLQPSLDANTLSSRAREWTPLHLAAFNGHVSAVQALLRIPGIDINARCGRTPGSAESTALHFAVMLEHTEVALLLLTVPGIMGSMVGDAAGWTPLHWAVQRQQAGLVGAMLQMPGVPLRAKSKDYGGEHPQYPARQAGLTALQMARSLPNNHINAAVVELLESATSVPNR